MIGAIMLLSKLDRYGGHDPPGVTLQMMLLRVLLLESTDCVFYP